MPVGRKATFEQVRYALEPGDGTRYAFSLASCKDHNGTIRGVGPSGDGYYTLALHSPDYGSYEVSKEFLLDPRRHRALYLSNHFTCNIYTMMAVLLAASVLVENPDDLEKAAAKMLQVPDFLK